MTIQPPDSDFRSSPFPSRPAVALVLALGAFAAHAQDAQEAIPPDPAAASAATPPLFQPGAWPAAGWLVTPQVGVATGYNDNLRLQSSARIASPFVALLPGLSVARAQGDNTLEFDWRSEWTRFTSSRDDDTLNSELSAAGLELIDPHTALTWNLALQDWHDALGLAAADDVAQTPDHFEAGALGAVLRHDSDDAGTHRFELEPTVSAKRYVNHREVTAVANANTASLVGRYLYLYEPGHRLGPELRIVRTNYPSDRDGLSDTDARGLGTLKWDAGAEVTGSLSIGGQRRWLRAPRRDYFGLVWEADWAWQFDPRTQFSFATTRTAGEAPGEGVDEVVLRRASLGVGHDWSASWHGTLSASTTTNHYIGAQVSRDDRISGIDATVRWDLSRTWRLSFNYGWTKRRSEIEAFNFERQLSSIEISAAI